jgi:hypothetical protein
LADAAQLVADEGSDGSFDGGILAVDVLTFSIL